MSILRIRFASATKNNVKSFVETSTVGSENVATLMAPLAFPPQFLPENLLVNLPVGFISTWSIPKLEGDDNKRE